MENPTGLEQEIVDIERRLAEKKAALQQAQGEVASESVLDKTVLREVVGEKINEILPQGLPGSTSVQSQSTLPPPISVPPSYLSDDLRHQVQELVNVAFTKSLAEAIKAVNKLNNPALLDAFHDVLVDQLYDTLVERGKLEKI